MTTPTKTIQCSTCGPQVSPHQHDRCPRCDRPTNPGIDSREKKIPEPEVK